MKSKIIKQRNIPAYPLVFKTVRVKPILFLFVVVIVGMFFILFNNELALIGVLMVGAGLFCLLVLPDVKIIEYTEEYIIAYNCREKDECKLIYWEDILNWQYKWRTDKDELIIKLKDHNIEVIDSYKKSTIVPYFKKFAADKEKSRKGKS